MIAAWMLYTLLVSALICVAAGLLDRLARGFGRPTRFIWLGAMIAAFALTVAPLVGASDAPMLARNQSIYLSWLSPVANFAVSELRSFVAAVIMLGSVVRPFGRQVIVLGSVSLTAIVVIMLAMSALRLRLRRSRWGAGTLHGENILVTDSVGPAVVGFGRPEIALPAWVLDRPDVEQRLIVEHERQHVVAHDALIRLVALVLVALQPWNAGLWLMFRRLRAATEVDCDRRLLHRFPDPDAYAALLVSVASRARRDVLLSPSLVESPGDLERRVRAILGSPRRPAALSTLARGLACAIILVLVWGTPAPAARLWSAARPRPVAPVERAVRLAEAGLRVQSLPTARCVPGAPIAGTTSGAFGITRGVRAQTYADSAGRGYLLIVRGAENWRGPDVERAGGQMRDGVLVFEPRPGDWRNTLTYEPGANVLGILGVRVPLDSGNVVLVDRIDGVGGHAVVEIGGCIALGSGWEAINRALGSLPAVPHSLRAVSRPRRRRSKRSGPTAGPRSTSCRSPPSAPTRGTRRPVLTPAHDIGTAA